MAKTKSRIQPFLEAVRNARQLIFTVIVIAIFAIAWLVQGGTIDMPEWTKDMRHLDGDDWTKYAVIIIVAMYINIEITLAGADTSFGKTIATAQGATYSGLTSTNGGKVRKISQIWVPRTV
ncbi:uncharacterized protein FSUBG_1977 [Fusarium subglutinans]|uniref:Uncharacterized protein n=1 Tax=Gibberella subglutinans TaxID=42677 RepID=A0A8H5Q933_GIBSU|nr:uncharacterized protein FSUBG_1977 [Fusarium subglutinans]KAF5611950.1 hypothetical protein FSUBG_1977 [Fusarium subglutinans]